MARVRDVRRIASRWTRRWCLAACACWLLGAGDARGDGAFPDSLSVLTPESLPNDIVLATNFGLVLSEDGGSTWTWTCESTQSANGSLYQIGPPPRNRLFAVAINGLVYSDDRSCTWNLAGGAPAGSTILDSFADPTNADRVLSVVSTIGDGGGPIYQIYESSDGGSTVGTLLYTAAAGDRILGVEVARSAPATIYLTIISGAPIVPRLARSTDGGAHWMLRDLTATLGSGINSMRIIAVDPQDASKVFLRVGARVDAGQEERLAVTTDGGMTASTPLVLTGGLISAFTRIANGHLIVGGILGASNVAYRSTDGGLTFPALPTPPTIKGLSARAGTVYAVTDNVKDGYAIATSADEGMTWHALMSYDQITAIRSCVMASCQTDCQMRADMDQWSSDLCTAVAPPPHDGGPPFADASTGGTAGTGGAGGTGGPHQDGGADAGSPPAKSGCHCNAAGGSPAGLGAVLLAVGLLLRRRRW